jgi:hypothetical protein
MTTDGAISRSPTSRRRLPSAPHRAPVRPLDDGTTEVVRVIQFVWAAGRGVQPVLMVERELLN